MKTILKKKGLNGTTQELITEILKDTKVRVKFKGSVPKEFEIKTGVVQGEYLYSGRTPECTI